MNTIEDRIAAQLDYMRRMRKGLEDPNHGPSDNAVRAVQERAIMRRSHIVDCLWRLRTIRDWHPA